MSPYRYFRSALLITLGILAGLVLRQVFSNNVVSEGVTAIDEITASAMWTESGVVIALPIPIEGSEYHEILIYSGDRDLRSPEQLTENSWSVPWKQGTIGGVLCTEDSCTVFAANWSVSPSYLWLKIIGVLVVGFFVLRFVLIHISSPLPNDNNPGAYRG